MPPEGGEKCRIPPERYVKLFAPCFEQPRKREYSMRNATKNLNWFGHGGIRAAAS
jgi:hypothetical protein